MQNRVKILRKSFCLFILLCALLSVGVTGWQGQTLTAYAAQSAVQNCTPPCTPPPDVYAWTYTQVKSYNGTSFNLVDDNNIGMTNGNKVSSQFGNIKAVIARGSFVYEMRTQYLFQIVYGGCSNTATGYCLTELDDNAATSYVAASGTGQLYQLHTSGTAWQSTGSCYHCWVPIDNNNATQIVAGTNAYELRSDHTVWRYNGCGNSSCWTQVDSNSTISKLAVSTTGTLYELRQVVINQQLASTSIMQGIGPFDFQTLDSVDLTNSIAASSRLYQLRTDDKILLYTGGNPAWSIIQNSTAWSGYLVPGGDSDAVYQQHPSDESIWRYTPAQGWGEILQPGTIAYGLSVPFASVFNAL